MKRSPWGTYSLVVSNASLAPLERNSHPVVNDVALQPGYQGDWVWVDGIWNGRSGVDKKRNEGETR